MDLKLNDAQIDLQKRAAATEDQRREYIPQLIAGKRRFSFALTEPGAGSDPGSIISTAKLRARPNGDDRWILSGEKYLTTGAVYADDILAVVKIAKSKAAPNAGSQSAADASPESTAMGVLVVPRASPGVEVRRLEALAGNAYSPCEIVFRDVELPRNALRGGDDVPDMLKHLANTADLDRLSVAASDVGGAARILRMCKKYAKGRTQFGKKIFDFQAVQHRLANMATGLEAMRQMSRWAAWRKSESARAFKEASMAKLFCSEQLQQIARDGMQIFSGRSFDANYDMGRLMRESHLALFAGGTSEIQRNLIARFA
jgi:alkylation response protein AidB-like acyl-CoA dehydrogenase